MAKPVRRERFTRLPDMFDWLESPLAAWSSFAAPTVRVEDFVENDRYVIRADLPGLDPQRDIELTVSDSTLTIHAERHEEHRDMYRSEFHYGTLTRTMKLPAGAIADDVKATYDKGVLTISVGLREAKPEGQRIVIEQGD